MTTVGRRLVCLLFVVCYSYGTFAQESQAYTQFLDFGAPCTDPHEELQGPAALNSNKSAPKSNPATPLTQPAYPALSRRMGEEGTAVVKLLVNETGVVSQVQLVQSTGSPRLDNAALEETRNWKLLPGKVDGQPRCMWGKFAVTFVLSDYMQHELQAVVATPEAQKLAALIMGVDELREMLVLSQGGSLSETEKRIVELTVASASKRREWLNSHDKVARILTIEFTQEELQELTDFFSRPVASKWRRANFKMSRTLLSEQRLISETLFCTLAGVKLAMEQELSDFSLQSSPLSDAHSLAIARFVDKAVPYCDCQRRAMSAPAASKGVLQSCGPPPRLVDK